MQGEAVLATSEAAGETRSPLDLLIAAHAQEVNA
jgi:hypothetical protein